MLPSPPNPSAGRDGVLATSQVLIPGLDPGTHTVRAVVSEVVVSIPFTITADDAPLPTTAADTTPDVAFKDLIDSGSLLTVFWYNEDTQSYLSYDPGSGQRRVQRPGDGRQRRHILGPVERGRQLPWQAPARRVGPGGATLKQSQTQDLRPWTRGPPRWPRDSLSNL